MQTSLVNVTGPVLATLHIIDVYIRPSDRAQMHASRPWNPYVLDAARGAIAPTETGGAIAVTETGGLLNCLGPREFKGNVLPFNQREHDITNLLSGTSVHCHDNAGWTYYGTITHVCPTMRNPRETPGSFALATVRTPLRKIDHNRLMVVIQWTSRYIQVHRDAPGATWDSVHGIYVHIESSDAMFFSILAGKPTDDRFKLPAKFCGNKLLRDCIFEDE